MTHLDIHEYWHEQEAELTTFLRCTTWQPGPATEGTGTTWIELYALFRA